MTELLQTQPGIRINHLMKNFTDERVDKNLIKDTQQQQDRAKDRIWAGGWPPWSRILTLLIDIDGIMAVVLICFDNAVMYLHNGAIQNC